MIEVNKRHFLKLLYFWWFYIFFFLYFLWFYIFVFLYLFIFYIYEGPSIFFNLRRCVSIFLTGISIFFWASIFFQLLYFVVLPIKVWLLVVNVPKLKHVVWISIIVKHVTSWTVKVLVFYLLKKRFFLRIAVIDFKWYPNFGEHYKYFFFLIDSFQYLLGNF
jgi:hypothetical protein